MTPIDWNWFVDGVQTVLLVYLLARVWGIVPPRAHHARRQYTPNLDDLGTVNLRRDHLDDH